MFYVLPTHLPNHLHLLPRTSTDEDKAEFEPHPNPRLLFRLSKYRERYVCSALLCSLELYDCGPRYVNQPKRTPIHNLCAVIPLFSDLSHHNHVNAKGLGLHFPSTLMFSVPASASISPYAILSTPYLSHQTPRANSSLPHL